MTFLVHGSSTFAAKAAAGFARVHSDAVQPVSGGVVRTTRSLDDEVAVVIGGGSGHYPAFAGLVGPGLAHGAVLGNIFASPSAHQVESVVRAVEQGRGVLLTYGNYAGDELQFDAASEVLEADGIAVRTVRVTDDVSSAPVGEEAKRRGIAGDLIVFKVAGAAAAAGYDLVEAHALAAKANDRTRSMGVAFTGCSLPGSDEPLVSVPAGRMSIGMGIHGEPGLDERDVPTPAELASILVGSLMVEAPAECARRAVVVVNGLGAFKHDEMYVLFGEVAVLLEAAGVEIVDAKVGEFCTSFEMAGVSLTLFWPDEELEALWKAPARSPEYAEGVCSGSEIALEVGISADEEAEADVPMASSEARAAARLIAKALADVVALIDEHAAELGRIDSLAGDGDHGIGMQHGSRAALAAAAEAVESGQGGGSVLAAAGDAWQDGAGGTSGALWGAILRSVGEHLGDEGAVEAARLRSGVRAAAAKVMAMGGAAVGDKTMVDALAPFSEALSRRTDQPIREAWIRAAAEARHGAEATAGMLPALGRARSHGAKAVGVKDPGAVSFALIVDRLTNHF